VPYNDDPAVILAGLEPMFKEAYATGKWFHCRYQDMWLRPDELRKAHRDGRLIWGAVNWRLRDPKEQADYLYSRITNAERDHDNFLERMKLDEHERNQGTV
jgi:hypothetical protein